MALNNISGNYEMLEEFYIRRILEIVQNLRAGSIVWQEVFQHGIRLPIDTIVHLWTGNRQRLLHEVRSAPPNKF